MSKGRFDYKHNRWAAGDTGLAKRWYDELKRYGAEHVRRQLRRQPAHVGPQAAIVIGEMIMTRGFAEDFLKEEVEEMAKPETFWTAMGAANVAAGWPMLVLVVGAAVAAIVWLITHR